MRVTGGALAGRRLSAPRGRGTRPSSDRTRESLFARLPPFEGRVADVLDLYAGSGALGIEALSRGAERAVFVERAGAALACLRKNLRELDLVEQAEVVGAPVRAALGRLARAGRRFDLILADPPYGAGAAEQVLNDLAANPVWSEGAWIVIEVAARHAPEPVEGFRELDARRQGDTLVVRYTPSLEGGRGDGKPAASPEQEAT